MLILGISAFYHDSAACIVEDGRIIAAAQEERFSRIKHDAGFPAQAVNYCLAYVNRTVADIDHVVFYENPAEKFNRIVDTFVHVENADPDLVNQAVGTWTAEKLWQEEMICRHLGYHKKILFPLHHQSHAAGAFFPSPFASAAILTMDGVGEWMTSTIGQGKGNRISLLRHQDFPHSLGLLYSAFTYFTGFRVNFGEYKLMGLAPYGQPRYADLIRDNLIDIKQDGSFRLNMDFFAFAESGSMINDRFRGLFGRRERHPEEDVSQDDMDLARSIQVVVEEVVLKAAQTARDITGEKNLCLAGGVALNCVANGLLLRAGIFENIWIQPASGDAGGALGAALLCWYDHLGNPRFTDEINDTQQGSLLGPEFSETQIREQLDPLAAVYETRAEAELLPLIARAIADGQIVGHFHGRMEFGPRALGNRSILGDARSPEMQRKMNLKIKYRESFRPFAPAVTHENVGEYFDFKGESPYMLITAPVHESIRRDVGDDEQGKSGLELLNVARSTLPAITHVDYSARVQTVSASTNPRFHGIIREVGNITGVPVVINTSFNVRGEPIVCTPFDAYACFMNTEMDMLVIGNCILEKEKQPEWDSSRQDRNFEMD
ncbi:MAG: carbamoyltransferase [Desulfobulbaceae bacterium]|nr:MAG: carbamoyltransferase [Desulfobulbaceae bacterium]